MAYPPDPLNIIPPRRFEDKNPPAAALSAYRRLRTFVAPWAEIAYLKKELRGAKTSCSAEAKRANRLAARIKVLDGKLNKRLAQSRHDQAYIDALESRLDPASIGAARQEINP